MQISQEEEVNQISREAAQACTLVAEYKRGGRHCCPNSGWDSVPAVGADQAGLKGLSV